VSQGGPSTAAVSNTEATRRVRENLPRPSAPPPSAPGPAPAQPARRKRSPFAWLQRLTPRFAGDVIAELKKVTWPTFAETRYLTIVVAIVALVMGIFLGGIDLLFGWIIERLFF
jgi:preprotein translocase subunit SecE